MTNRNSFLISELCPISHGLYSCDMAMLLGPNVANSVEGAHMTLRSTCIIANG